ncbi:MAG TPA: DUF6111 family protein [Xanthobacteraceae bacterium]
MIRPLFTELALFLIPFLIYAAYLWATRAGVLDPSAWPAGRLAWLLVAAGFLMAGGFVLLAEFGGAPAGSTYVPAHVDDGKLKPGATK